MKKTAITVFTPTYNRADTLHRCFESLQKQSFRDFVWLIIDDGSTDNTRETVDGFIAQKPFFEIVYIYQENSGKHIAKNRAAAMCNSEFFITLDSDDACTPDAFEVFYTEWNKLPDSDKPKYYGISCRTCDTDGKIQGTPMNEDYIDCNDLDLKLRHGIKGELWGMVRTDIVRAFPSPEIEGMKYYPESIIWNTVGKQYKCRYLNKALRYYINDCDNAVTNVNRKAATKEKYFMHLHYINDCWEYRKYDRKRYLEHLIALTRDGKANGKSVGKIMGELNSPGKRALTLITAPAGLALYYKSR